MTDLSNSIDVWTYRLVELAGDALDEEEARNLVREIHKDATGMYQDALAELEAEREE